MKAFTISAALAVLSTLTSAAPALQTREYAIEIAYLGADPPATFTQIVTADGSNFVPTPDISVSHIKVAGPGDSVCFFYGIDESVTVVFGGQTRDVGPPQ
ncbi:MAG: hypothetical protein Q9174_005489, partial [Haloplaca sp. 1 TL-2023]